MWQSSNEGYTWIQLYPTKRILAFYHHKYSNDRAYLITDTEQFYYTTDTGRTWNAGSAPTPPNTFGANVLHFHPTSDLLIWTGNRDCNGRAENCRAEAQYSRDNGRSWVYVESYVRNCAFAKDKQLDADPTEIVCESYRDKKGSQRHLGGDNPLELVAGRNYFEKSTKRRLFENVVGFTKFSEFFIVAEVRLIWFILFYFPFGLIVFGSIVRCYLLEELWNCKFRWMGIGLRQGNSLLRYALKLMYVLFLFFFFFFSLLFIRLFLNQAYTVLESSTSALFLHMTVSEPPAPYWGTILKSNSNGTYFGISIENVNRDERGYVDFEKMIGLDGIALINVVVNPEEATVTNSKRLQSRITHNDGGCSIFICDFFTIDVCEYR